MSKSETYTIDIDFDFPVLREPAPECPVLSMDDYASFINESMQRAVPPEQLRERQKCLPADAPFMLD
ncbi:MAG: hypothetical protein GF350_00790 [Chitinivibrionales bacterium]|nr:hypothetical protein [Chitinivibrionales bacterium]